MKITVFTPTYNRAHTLLNLYNSLLNQDYRDFEWVIIDDGSTDNTKDLIHSLIEENKIDIRYEYQQNGGKHRAINRGVDIAAGELFYIVDSDDWLPNNALQVIIQVEQTIIHKELFCGVCGLRGYDEHKMQGTTFCNDELFMDLVSMKREKYNITGDKAEVFYTQVLKRYKFPEIPGENFLTEAVVWDRISHDGYMYRFFNTIVYCGEHLPDGLIAQGMNKYIENPIGWGLYINQCYKFSKYSLNWFVGSISDYYRRLEKEYSDSEIAVFLDLSLKKMKWYLFLSKLFGIKSFLWKSIRMRDNKNQ